MKKGGEREGVHVVARVGHRINIAYRDLVGKPEGKNPLL
jgi:hypothetical protein